MEGGTLQDLTVILLAVAVVALCAVILSTVVRATIHKRSLVVDSTTEHLVDPNAPDESPHGGPGFDPGLLGKPQRSLGSHKSHTSHKSGPGGHGHGHGGVYQSDATPYRQSGGGGGGYDACMHAPVHEHMHVPARDRGRPSDGAPMFVPQH